MWVSRISHNCWQQSIDDKALWFVISSETDESSNARCAAICIHFDIWICVWFRCHWEILFLCEHRDPFIVGHLLRHHHYDDTTVFSDETNQQNHRLQITLSETTQLHFQLVPFIFLRWKYIDILMVEALLKITEHSTVSNMWHCEGVYCLYFILHKVRLSSVANRAYLDSNSSAVRLTDERRNLFCSLLHVYSEGLVTARDLSI